MPLKVTAEQRTGGLFALRPEGSIDATTHTILGAEVDAILKKAPKVVVFDLQDVTYVSSAGVGVVLRTEKALRSRGGKVMLVNLKPPIRKVFDIVKALPAEQLFSSVRELDQYLAEMQRKVEEGEIA